MTTEKATDLMRRKLLRAYKPAIASPVYESIDVHTKYGAVRGVQVRRLARVGRYEGSAYYTTDSHMTKTGNVLFVRWAFPGGPRHLADTIDVLPISMLLAASKRGWVRRVLLGGPYYVLYRHMRSVFPELPSAQQDCAKLCMLTITELGLT